MSARILLAVDVVRIKPAGEEKLEATETGIDALLIRLHALNLVLVDAFVLCHQLVVAAGIFLAAAVECMAFLPFRQRFDLHDQ